MAPSCSASACSASYGGADEAAILAASRHFRREKIGPRYGEQRSQHAIRRPSPTSAPSTHTIGALMIVMVHL